MISALSESVFSGSLHGLLSWMVVPREMAHFLVSTRSYLWSWLWTFQIIDSQSDLWGQLWVWILCRPSSPAKTFSNQMHPGYHGAIARTKLPKCSLEILNPGSSQPLKLCLNFLFEFLSNSQKIGKKKNAFLFSLFKNTNDKTCRFDKIRLYFIFFKIAFFTMMVACLQQHKIFFGGWRCNRMVTEIQWNFLKDWVT